MIRLKLSLASLAGALFLVGAAQAQSVMAPGAMPPPPSFRDSTKPADGQGQKRRARKPATQAEGEVSAETETAAPRRKLRATRTTPSAPSGGYSSRVDDRPQPTRSQGMQLEDDPRAVTPMMSNGRAGVGMRF